MDVVADELDLGETEIVNTDGSVSVQRSKKLNDEEKAAEEARIATDTVNDPQYEVHKKKAAVRMKRIEAKFVSQAAICFFLSFSFFPPSCLSESDPDNFAEGGGKDDRPGNSQLWRRGVYERRAV